MTDLNEKASALARILSVWQITGNNGMPGIVLMAQLEIVHRLAGELIEELAKDPSTTVHIDSELSDGAAEMLSDYFQGRTYIPDTPEGLD